MKSYLLDEVSPPDMEKIEAFLVENAMASGIRKFFWVPFPHRLLGPTQRHHPECQPHVFAVEMGAESVKMEFFVRTLRGMGCECQAPCTHSQLMFVIEWAEKMIATLGVRT